MAPGVKYLGAKFQHCNGKYIYFSARLYNGKYIIIPDIMTSFRGSYNDEQVENFLFNGIWTLVSEYTFQCSECDQLVKNDYLCKECRDET